jgi:hypothetical protein
MITLYVGFQMPIQLQLLDENGIQVSVSHASFQREPKWFSSKPDIIRLDVSVDKLTATASAIKPGKTTMTITYCLTGSKPRRTSKQIGVLSK